MEGTVDGFRYGLVTPVAAFVMACLGGALGLRCIVRTLLSSESWKPGWLALGAASIGCGIWTMHFIAMIGFQVVETRIRYDVGLTVLSLAVAIVVVGIGVFIVGYRGAGTLNLSFAGVITGLGVAAMHYLGMAALHLNGTVHYDPVVVALSVVIAVVAATAALWAAVTIRGFLTSLGASLIMGVAVTGMHYTGMSAVSVHVHARTGGSWAGGSPTSLLLPMLVGPAIFLLLAGVVIMFDPLLVLGDGDWNRSPASAVVAAPRSGSLFEHPENQENRSSPEDEAPRVVQARAPQDPQWAVPRGPRR
ncbi:MHYT domain-containing protein [Streptomyces griseorubiginosus]|uniref:MHYT domain-containing protein n=1 Tax=Streptomyces griseorubiginosus TaxID=67304 RepID=UPI0036461D60